MTTPIEFSLNQPASDPRNWYLDPSIVYLNHGAFGACPKKVLEVQTEWRMRLERQPLQFLARDLEPALDEARAILSGFVGADDQDLVFVPCATAGVNAVLRSLSFKPGDELLVTDHEYNASRNVLDFVAAQSGARVVVARIPFPLQKVEQMIDPVLAAVTERTKLVLLDHVSSPTGLVMPIERLVKPLSERGIEILIDGAHAPGMLPLSLKQLGATYYTGNCHKWMCAPKGAAFLYVERSRQKHIRPTVISHGANSTRKDRSRFLIEFGWTGTGDGASYLCVPEAIRFMERQMPGGWPSVMARNRALTLAARKLISSAFKIDPPCPEECIGSLASIPLTNAPAGALPRQPVNEYPMQEELLGKYKIEVPIMAWPAPPKRVLRISAQLYNFLPQYELLANALLELK